jgi:hypothetical protein
MCTHTHIHARARARTHTPSEAAQLCGSGGWGGQGATGVALGSKQSRHRAATSDVPVSPQKSSPGAGPGKAQPGSSAALHKRWAARAPRRARLGALGSFVLDAFRRCVKARLVWLPVNGVWLCSQHAPHGPADSGAGRHVWYVAHRRERQCSTAGGATPSDLCSLTGCCPALRHKRRVPL